MIRAALLLAFLAPFAWWLATLDMSPRQGVDCANTMDAAMCEAGR